MPESVAVISPSRQLQLRHAASSTLETAGIYLAAPKNFLGRRGREGAVMEQVLANLLGANPHAFSTRTQKAASLFPLLGKDLTAETWLHERFSAGYAAQRQVGVATPTNR